MNGFVLIVIIACAICYIHSSIFYPQQSLQRLKKYRAIEQKSRKTKLKATEKAIKKNTVNKLNSEKSSGGAVASPKNETDSTSKVLKAHDK
ncbi:unnamed protein product [Moneuplotes crassus]|uniref:Uncharacterized protein n=1 Tax=Euplotes crassus TaxID=5936 RepID=A0AAD2D9I9_EUPCR|nr:unnamed protein product [Moneuplotes crassus]